jgi:hypothetical protein
MCKRIQFLGIETYEYIADKNMFGNGTVNPENKVQYLGVKVLTIFCLIVKPIDRCSYGFLQFISVLQSPGGFSAHGSIQYQHLQVCFRNILHRGSLPALFSKYGTVTESSFCFRFGAPVFMSLPHFYQVGLRFKLFNTRYHNCGFTPRSNLDP